MVEDEGDYFVVDIETCPADLTKYEELSEEDKKKLINPIDSRVVATGIRFKNNNIIFNSKTEKEILEDFWLEWRTIRKGGSPN